MKEVLTQALARFFNFVGDGVHFFLGLLAVAVVAALPSATAVLHVIVHHNGMNMDWDRIIDAMGTSEVLAIGAYITAKAKIQQYRVEAKIAKAKKAKPKGS